MSILHVLIALTAHSTAAYSNISAWGLRYLLPVWHCILKENTHHGR
jgi:hypothetical protein